MATVIIEKIQDLNAIRQRDCPQCDACERDGLCWATFKVRCPQCKKVFTVTGEEVENILHYGCLKCANQ